MTYVLEKASEFWLSILTAQSSDLTINYQVTILILDMVILVDFIFKFYILENFKPSDWSEAGVKFGVLFQFPENFSEF